MWLSFLPYRADDLPCSVNITHRLLSFEAKEFRLSFYMYLRHAAALSLFLVILKGMI